MTEKQTERLLVALILIVVVGMGFYLFHSWRNCRDQGGVLVMGVPVLQCAEPRR